MSATIGASAFKLVNLTSLSSWRGKPDPLGDLIRALACRKLGAVKIFGDLHEASLTLITINDSRVNELPIEFLGGGETMVARDKTMSHGATVLVSDARNPNRFHETGNEYRRN